MFNSAPAKDDHILEHFAQETCVTCEKNLIRIGGNLYTLHDTRTCVKEDESSEKQSREEMKPCVASVELPSCENRYDVNNEVSSEAAIASGFEEILIKIEAEEDQEQQEQLEYIVMDTIDLPDDNIIQPELEPQITTLEEALKNEIKSDSLPEPIEIENDGTILISICDVCGGTFECEISLESHRKQNHDSNSMDQKLILPETSQNFIVKAETTSKTNFCDVCGQPFDCELFLESHKKLKHGSNVSYRRPNIPATEPNRIGDSQTKKVPCDICGQSFECQIFLESHKKLKHSSVEMSAPKVIPRPKAGKCNVKSGKHGGKRLKLEGKPEKKFECLICYKMYSSDTSLRTHVETIHDPSARKFPCKLCDQAFFRECALQAHHEQVHLNLKNFVCSFCGVRLKSKAALKRHTYRHTGERPIKCLWRGCQKTFSCSSNRDEHLRSHTGEKPFHCTIDGCNSRFSYACDFRKHKFVVHNISTKKFTCKICTAIFPQNGMLKKHMEMHDNKDND